MTHSRVVVEAKALSYARLAKLDIYDYYLSILLVWALLAPAERFDGGMLALLAVFLVGEVLMMAGLVALDDHAGYRDGSDRVNYGPDAPARRLRRKPLLAGTLTEPEVTRFAWATTVLGALLWTVVLLLAPEPAGWAVVLAVVTIVCYPQYSWGLKFSYRGMQELYIAALGWALVLVPYGLLIGDASVFVVCQALVFGLGPLLFGVYSNTNDIEGDRGVGRPTVAALVSPRGNARFVAAVSLAELALIAGPTVTGHAPWWFPLAMLPTILLRARQFWLGFGRGDILRARTLGIRIHRVTAGLLIAGNLVAASVA